ncbi:autism susceptibility protein 2 [Platysternon megacephalum]|uniref:Autism susceptibility protein 2 n=1 Tax=Platysternon megacephalum TaxID=55544 RepID=A0A4D9DPB6_9SAUR|nr:autism susceptibility protein 2 [Platysternon megacephalum]
MPQFLIKDQSLLSASLAQNQSYSTGVAPGLHWNSRATSRPPSVFPLVPCCTKTGNAPPDTSLACLVTGYLPSPVDIKWNSGKVTQGVKDFPEVTMSDGLHTRSSLLILPDRSRQGDTYQCDVTHQGTKQNMSKKFPQKWCDSTTPPQVHLLVPTCEDSSTESQLELLGEGGRQVTHPALGTELSMHNTSKCLACLRSSLDPTIYLTKPSYEDVIKNSGHVTCLVLGYDLAASRITWKVDGQVSSAAKTEPLKKNSNGTTSLVSSHPVSLAQWGQGTKFTCKVTTPCSGELTQDIPMSHTGISKKEPSVTISRAYHEDISGNRVSLTLICEASGFYPEEISISWLKNNSPELKSSYNNGPVSGSGIFSAYSVLKVEQSQGEGNYTCMVHQPAMEEPKSVVEKVTLGVSNCNRNPLEVSLLPPSLEDLYIAQNATMTCLVSGMETPGSLEVSWNRGSGGPLAVVSREPVLQEDGTYSATSILRVCVEEWQDGEEFTCTVKHQDIPSAIVKTIRKSHMVSLRAPSVYVSPPHAEELALRESATITCLASGFWPRDILVTWTQQDRPVPQEAYTNIGPVREVGKEELYFIYSKLNVLASEWQRGDTYACVVGHEGLPMTFIHRSMDKSSGKPTAVNVSVILSDTDVSCY